MTSRKKSLDRFSCIEAGGANDVLLGELDGFKLLHMPSGAASEPVR